jgi:hypothetical protein
MAIEVEILAAGAEQQYARFLAGLPDSMVYSSLEYRDFLRQALPDARDVYFVARHRGDIVGVLPTFLSAASGPGPLLNSLPFFGSHGGLLLATDAETSLDAAAAEKALIEAYLDFEVQQGVAASTWVESPFRPLSERSLKLLAPTHGDARFGQFTNLPPAGIGRPEIEARLLAACHQKTRNAIRKAQRLSSAVVEDASTEALVWLHREHQRAIAELGGVVKPLPTLESLLRAFPPGRRSRLYRAYVNGEPAAALLLLYYGRFVEYFMPVTTVHHRGTQVLSALVFHAMADAAMLGYEIWNWGGTWPSQEGVYRFKARWGARSVPYRYHVRVVEKDLLCLEPTVLRQCYPYFYAFPFSASMSPGHATQ